MIFGEQTLGDEIELEGMAVKQPVNIVSLEPVGIEQEFNLCDFECCYQELSFAYPSDPSDKRRNDLTELLTTKKEDGSTVVFKLIREDGTEIILNDDTYGTYYPEGSFSSQPLKVGFVIDWLKVFNALGGGLYRPQIVQTDFAVESVFNRWEHKLQIYSDLSANETVKIHTVHEGIVKNREDYEGIRWERWIRIPAVFGNKEIVTELNNYETTGNKILPIRDRLRYTYTLSTELLISEIANRFFEDLFQANEFYVTNYNVFGNEIFNEKRVYNMPEETSPEYYVRNTKASYTFQFLDYDQSNIKYNI